MKEGDLVGIIKRHPAGDTANTPVFGGKFGKALCVLVYFNYDPIHSVIRSPVTGYESLMPTTSLKTIVPSVLTESVEIGEEQVMSSTGAISTGVPMSESVPTGASISANAPTPPWTVATENVMPDFTAFYDEVFLDD